MWDIIAVAAIVAIAAGYAGYRLVCRPSCGCGSGSCCRKATAGKKPGCACGGSENGPCDT